MLRPHLPSGAPARGWPRPHTHTPPLCSPPAPARSFCEYPQEIGLQFIDGNVQLSQVQLLSHQSKISTRIELYMGTGPEYMRCQFTRLGYLSLDSNERSAFKARELKSVYLKSKGVFMKLLLHKCHINALNLHNQVGLIALNMLGTAVPRAAAASQLGGSGSYMQRPGGGLPAPHRCALRCARAPAPARPPRPPSRPFLRCPLPPPTPPPLQAHCRGPGHERPRRGHGHGPRDGCAAARGVCAQGGCRGCRGV